jgi:hypothetical protein
MVNAQSARRKDRGAGKIAHCRKLAAMWSKSAGWMASLNFRRAGDIRARF